MARSKYGGMAALEARLPTYIHCRVADGTALVECPNCNCQFSVDGKRWRQSMFSVIDATLEITGRSCPYCMKVALIPLEYYPKQVRAAYAARRG